MQSSKEMQVIRREDRRHRIMQKIHEANKAERQIFRGDFTQSERNLMASLRASKLIVPGPPKLCAKSHTMPVELTPNGEIYCQRFFEGRADLTHFPQPETKSWGTQAMPLNERPLLDTSELYAAPIRAGALDASKLPSLHITAWKKKESPCPRAY